jgi:hypothetical protein
MEDFVSFEIAKKLTEKGFKQKCLAYYDVEDNVGLLYNTQYTDEVLPCQYTDLLQCHNTGEAETQSDDSGFCVDAPTISQVLKWLREEKKIHIEHCILADADTDADDKVINEFTYWSFRIVSIVTGDMIYFEYKHIDDRRFNLYEEATIAGIEYVINNLI